MLRFQIYVELLCNSRQSEFRALASSQLVLAVRIHYKTYRKCVVDLVTGAGIMRNLARACGIDEKQACPANQSTTHWNWGVVYSSASFANDGLLDNDFSHTEGAPGVCGAQNDNTPWWMVDFGRTRSISSGKIWGRTDCCMSRLDGFQIWVGDSSTAYDAHGNSKCYTAYTTEHGQPPYSHFFSCAESGRYVFVVLPSGQCLTLSEVEIYSTGENPSGPDALI
jgi:hypothetical protein